VKAYVLCPNENIGDLLQLILEKRGTNGPHRDAGIRGG